MKPAIVIIKQNLKEEECNVPFSVIELMMEEYAAQFRPREYKQLSLRKWQLRQIMMETCGKLGVTEEQMASKTRKREVTDARAIFVRKSKEEMNQLSWRDIGACINKDHSTVIAAYKRSFDVKEIVTKYNKCYANQAQIAYSIMASAGGTGIRSVVKTSKGPVVSYGSVEKRGEGVFEKEPALQEVRSTG